MPLLPLLHELVFAFGYTSYRIPKRITSEAYRHKKARQAYALRASRTSSQTLVTIDKEFWAGGV